MRALYLPLVLLIQELLCDVFSDLRSHQSLDRLLISYGFTNIRLARVRVVYYQVNVVLDSITVKTSNSPQLHHEGFIFPTTIRIQVLYGYQSQISQPHDIIMIIRYI